MKHCLSCLTYYLSSLLTFPDNPFILSNVAGNPCQKVCGAKETKLSFRTLFDNILREEYPSSITGKVKPAGTTLNHEVELNYCYYEKMNDGWYYKECDFICSGCLARKLKIVSSYSALTLIMGRNHGMEMIVCLKLKRQTRRGAFMGIYF